MNRDSYNGWVVFRPRKQKLNNQGPFFIAQLVSKGSLYHPNEGHQKEVQDAPPPYDRYKQGEITPLVVPIITPSYPFIGVTTPNWAHLVKKKWWMFPVAPDGWKSTLGHNLLAKYAPGN